VPSLAVADALSARGARVTFAGSPDRVEAQLVPAAGYDLDTFGVSGLPRKAGGELLRALWLDAGAPLACRRIIARRHPDVVLGGGGYVSGPMVLAAWTCGVPAALTEADAHFGLANRLAVPFARRVFLSFPIEGRSDGKYRVTGRPLPRRSKAVIARAEARHRFGLPEEGALLLVMGGSQGARVLNELAAEAFGRDGPAVLHLTGASDEALVRGRVSRSDYQVVAFTDELGVALAAADLVLARSGGSVFELAAAGTPAVLVPYPQATADHQTKNAHYFVERGGAVLVPQTELAWVPGVVRALLADPARLAAMSTAMRQAARPDAADVIAEELIALASA
jgi:UDP-N-acetylglucosamine--N-acetylmuramyl-(pentapeptide) pyrophosphoryl-undecaprenol N-acetylglucosamine transferase